MPLFAACFLLFSSMFTEPQHTRFRTVAGVLISVILAASGAAQESSYAYIVGPGDLLQITVFEEDRLNVDLRVGEDGQIELPLLGGFSVEGLNPSEVARSLKASLEASYLQRASVSVVVLEANSRPISVMGAVRAPGNLNWTGRLTLLEALNAAGGLSTERGGVVTVLRTAENGLSAQIEISIEELLSGRRPETNIPIRGSDLINVPAETVTTIYLLGEVKSPGSLDFQSGERVTILMALARAGGLTDRAANKITLRREDGEGGTIDLTFNYKHVLSGKEDDVALQNQDLIWIKESFF